MAIYNKPRFGSRPAGPQSKKKSYKSGGKKQTARRVPRPPSDLKPLDPEDTGRETAYLKDLVDREKPVVVVLSSGETLRGIVRYYDREVFSLGPADGSPKLFLRKTSIRYMYEE